MSKVPFEERFFQAIDSVDTSQLSAEERFRLIRVSTFSKVKCSPSGALHKVRSVARGNRQGNSLYSSTSLPKPTPDAAQSGCEQATMERNRAVTIEIGGEDPSATETSMRRVRKPKTTHALPTAVQCRTHDDSNCTDLESTSDENRIANTSLDVHHSENHSYTSTVPLLQPTTNHTEVFGHFKATTIALVADGYTIGTRCLDPRTEPPFTGYVPPEYDPIRYSISPSAAACLTKEELDDVFVNSVVEYESERRHLTLRCQLEQKRIYYLVRKTLSAASIGKANALDKERLERAEVDRDTAYLVEAVIASHIGAGTNGLTEFAMQGVRAKRQLQYLSDTHGSLTLHEYLVATYSHIAAIKYMDSSVGADGTGGFLGSRSDQVSKFIRGTRATKIINLLSNGILEVPHSLEEACTLLTNWAGPLVEEESVCEEVCGPVTNWTSPNVKEKSAYCRGPATTSSSAFTQVPSALKAAGVKKKYRKPAARAKCNLETPVSGATVQLRGVTSVERNASHMAAQPPRSDCPAARTAVAGQAPQSMSWRSGLPSDSTLPEATTSTL